MPWWLKSTGGSLSDSLTGLLVAGAVGVALLVASAAGALPPEIDQAVHRLREALFF